jgi:sodium transport system permease protein
MRWSIIRLIWARELRDQLRDRRTLFMIAVLPLVLYPAGAVGMLFMVSGFRGEKSTVRIVGSNHLPVQTPLLDPAGEKPRFNPAFLEAPSGGGFLQGLLLHGKVPEDPTLRVELSDEEAASIDEVDLADLQTRKVDVILFVPPDFADQVARGRPELALRHREGDDRSRLVYDRVKEVLQKWKKKLKEARLRNAGLPDDFDEPFKLQETKKSQERKASEQISMILAQVFPFVLVMWSLAGALYPAVDLCAGEKERGTMETLLISPASREEIVWGKFLTIWVFSAATALLNLFSMGMTTFAFASLDDRIGSLVSFQLSFLFWGALLLVPLSAFFSALCLSVGVYARSSKEGQYYLMPLFLLTMPLVFLTMIPGVELNHFYSMVPVTGVTLFLQELMKLGAHVRLLAYLVPVLAPMVLYSWLALRWAIEQFQREEVLFREAERLDIGLWLKRLFRDKEDLPSTGQALFCFVLILAVHWLAFTVVKPRASLVYISVVYLAFVAAPPLFMSLMLTRRPADSLGLAPAPVWSYAVAVLLAMLLFLPGAELIHHLLHTSPGLRQALEASQPVLQDHPPERGGVGLWLAFYAPLLAIAALQGVTEELAFRGFMFSGLRARFRPGMAIFLSSFLFALFQMNVFQFVPHLLLGAVMGYLVWRTGSVFPAMLFHFVYNALVYTLLTFPAVYGRLVDSESNLTGGAMALGVGAAMLAGGLLVLVHRRSASSGAVKEPSQPVTVSEGRHPTLP